MQVVNARTMSRANGRRAVVSVEVALTLPIFVVFLAGLMEFCHVFLVSHMLNAACREGALMGCYKGVTAAEVQARVEEIVEGAFDAAETTVIVRDASVFDDPNVSPETLDYSGLPSIDLTQANAGDPFLVQVTVPYDDVALLPPFWVQDYTVRGRSVMRHE
jgi:Flp pilus assembly protein TadG